MKIQVRDLFSDGNAFFILSKCLQAAKKAGMSKEQILNFEMEAKSGDYDHLIQTVMEYFEEAREGEE